MILYLTVYFNVIVFHFSHRSVAHDYPTGVLISQGAGRAAHYSCADVSGLCFTPKAA